MGVEDYGARLVTEEEAPSLQAVDHTLLALGFRRDQGSPEPRSSNARAYTCDDGRHIIEALVRWDTTADDARVRSVSLRFEVCQPGSAVDNFIRLASQLAEQHEFVIEDGYTRERYPPAEMEGFCKSAKQWVQRLKHRWEEIFEGDTEEPKVAVAQAWPYFQSKHPGV